MSDSKYNDPLKFIKALENSSLNQTLKAFQKQNKLFELTNAQSQIGAIAKGIDQYKIPLGSSLQTIQKASSLQNSFKSSVLPSTIFDAFGIGSVVEKFNEQQRAWRKTIDSLGIGSIQEQFNLQRMMVRSNVNALGLGSVHQLLAENSVDKNLTEHAKIGGILDRFREQNIFLNNYLKEKNKVLATLNLNRIQIDNEHGSIFLSELLSWAETNQPDVQAEVTNYFDELNNSSNTQSPNNTSPKTISMWANLIIIFILQFSLSQIESAFFEFVTKPQIEAHYSPKEVKSIIKEEVKKNELNTLYGKRITLTDLNLRDMPKQSATLLETIETGKVLYIVEEKGLHKSWLKVEIDFNGEKVQGYVLRRYTTIIKP